MMQSFQKCKRRWYLLQYTDLLSLRFTTFPQLNIHKSTITTSVDLGHPSRHLPNQVLMLWERAQTNLPPTLFFSYWEKLWEALRISQNQNFVEDVSINALFMVSLSSKENQAWMPN